MNIHKIFKIHFFLIICLIFSSQLVLAAGIKDRIKQRLPVIADLKTKGVIGEDNRGYLGFVTGASEQQSVIAAENKDRKMIYKHFAKQQNTTIEFIEEIQANRKAKKAKPGEFIQSRDGSWHKK
ncbi:MAG: YdbL family protein [Desulfobacula sp.]|jgi:uncharacterized protein|nr:YdbL family protein [Desulfobacula sp.]MBT4289321.1 YdbL family protein [Deltaproteobacteria bacterium]MBT6340417.1 YdbL family protein [Desulfobacula sp.]